MTEPQTRRKDADAIYILGIARQASPIDRIKNRYREFQKRMMSATLPELPVPSIDPSSTGRTVLGDTTAPGSSAPTVALSSTSHQNELTSPPSRPNGRLQVFVDSSSEEQSAGIQTNAWPELGTRKGRIKENIPEVKKMAGTTIRQPGRSARVAASTTTVSQIVPYRDPEPSRRTEIPPLPARPSQRTKGVPKTQGKSIEVFRDGEDTTEVPCTPKFTPFRDEVRLVISSICSQCELFV
jgi:hypothetical protein